MSARKRKELATLTAGYQAAARPVISRRPSPERRAEPRKRRSFLGLTTSPFVERFYSDLYHTVRDAPRGAATFGQAMYDDWQAPMREAKAWHKAAERAKRQGKRPPPKPKLSVGDYLSFPRTRKLGRATAGAFYEDLRHPLRHPGNTLLSVAGVGTGGIGLGVKGAGVLGAARSASKVRRVHVPRSAGKGLDKTIVKQLRKEQRGRNPAVAVVRELAKKPPVPLRIAGAAGAVNLNARRQRAAREMAASADAYQAAARPVSKENAQKQERLTKARAEHERRRRRRAAARSRG